MSILKGWSSSVSFLVLAMALVPCALGQGTQNSVNEIQRLSRAAQVARDQGRYDDAIRAYNQIAVIASGEPKVAARAQLSLGNTYMQMKKFDLAMGAFQRAISLDANLAEAHNNIGEALGEQQARVEDHARAEITGRSCEHCTRLGFGLRMFAFGEELACAFDGCRSSGIHGRHPNKRRAAWQTPRGPSEVIPTSGQDQNLYVAEIEYRRPSVSYVFTSVFALVTLF